MSHASGPRSSPTGLLLQTIFSSLWCLCGVVFSGRINMFVCWRNVFIYFSFLYFDYEETERSWEIYSACERKTSRIFIVFTNLDFYRVYEIIKKHKCIKMRLFLAKELKRKTNFRQYHFFIVARHTIRIGWQYCGFPINFDLRLSLQMPASVQNLICYNFHSL